MDGHVFEPLAFAATPDLDHGPPALLGRVSDARPGLASPPSSAPSTPSDEDDGGIFSGPQALTARKSFDASGTDYFTHSSSLGRSHAPTSFRWVDPPKQPTPAAPVALTPLTLTAPDPAFAWVSPTAQRQLLPAIQLGAYGHSQSSPPVFRPTIPCQTPVTPVRAPVVPARAEPVAMASLPVFSAALAGDPLLAPIESGEVDRWSMSGGDEDEEADEDDEDDAIVWPASVVAGAECSRMPIAGGRHAVVWLFPAARAARVMRCRTIYEGAAC